MIHKKASVAIGSYIKNAVGNAKIFVTNRFTSMIPTIGASTHMSTFADYGLNLFGFGKQDGQVISQILKKSPMEIPHSPEEAIKENPLSFSNIVYPADLTGMELGHYIIFFTLNNNMDDDLSDTQQDINFLVSMDEDTGRSKPEDYEQDNIAPLSRRRLKEAHPQSFWRKELGLKQVEYRKGTVSSAIPKNQMVTGAIALYMPPDVKVSYQAGWGAEDALLAGDIASVTKEVMDAQGGAEKIKAAIKGARGAAVNYVGQAVSGLLEAFGGGDAFKLTSKIMGIAVNPRQEMYYQGPKFRKFDYEFKFWPRNSDESVRAQKVIKMFKYHMHPTLDSSFGGRMFKVPSEFEIHYLHKDKANPNLHQISRCALESCTVKYGPDEGNFKTFDDGAPVSYTLSLGFVELEFLTKHHIHPGANYNEAGM